MRAFSVSWNGEIDCIKIKFADDFERSNSTIKLDILADAIYDLREIYNKTIPQSKAKLNSKRIIDDSERDSILESMSSRIVELTTIEEFRQHHKIGVKSMFDEMADEELMSAFKNFKPEEYIFNIG